jgi:SAM-dependent methyltransferase
MKPVIIDIGCGERKTPGAIGLDIAPLKTVDVLGDVTFGLPFKDSTADRVHASHLLEHFEDLPAVMKEVWRVCKPGGRFYVTVPHSSSHYMTWRDPTHKRGVNLSTLTYFDRSTFEGNLFSYYAGIDFRIVYSRLRFVPGGNKGRYAEGRRFITALFTDFLEAVANRSPGAQRVCERWWGHWFGVAEAYAVLEAVKPA